MPSMHRKHRISGRWSRNHGRNSGGVYAGRLLEYKISRLSDFPTACATAQLRHGLYHGEPARIFIIASRLGCGPSALTNL